MSDTQASPASGFRLLVVDDNEMNRDMLSRRLRRKKYEVDVAEDGQQALDMIAERAGTPEAYGLILLDIMMPGIDGIEVLKRLREDYSHSKLPIIMATAKDTSEDVVEALKLGANDYVTKPLDFPVVLARVNTQMELKRAHDDLEKRNAFIKKVFGRYLTDEVVAQLLDTDEGLKFGGESREVTVLMSDVRGFSSLCERLSPEQVVTILNIYLGAMAEVVNAHNGTIDEFIGDAILAIFNAPLTDPDHRIKAVRCALGMQRAMAGVNAILNEKGLPELEMGIGVNTGDVVVGNIGSEHRAKYGVVGSNVNLTARVESFTVGGQVLIGANTAYGVEDQLTVSRSYEVEAKGIDGPFRILDVVGIDGDPETTLETAAESLTDVSPVDVQFTVLEGKHIGREMRAGQLVALSDKGARIVAEGETLSVLCNLRLTLGDDGGEAYAKVLEVNDSTALIRFTSLTPAFQSGLPSAHG